MLLQDLRRGEAIQNRLNRGPSVDKLHGLELPAIHELHSFTELPLFKAVAVGHVEVLVEHLEALDPIQPVDGREEIVRVLKVRPVLQKGGQVEVILGKHDPYRLNPPAHQPGLLHTLVGDLHHLPVLDRLADLPQAV